MPQPIVIQAEVQHICPNDFDGWSAFEKYESPDLYDDFSWFTLTIGTTDIEGTNNFQVCISTARAVSRAKLDGSIAGIIVDRFDAETVGDAIHERVNSIKAHTWSQIVDELRKFMLWEYEGMAGT